VNRSAVAAGDRAKSASIRHTFATVRWDDEHMLNLEMTCSRGCALLVASGSILTGDDVDTLAAALSFVPVDDDLVVDLSRVDHLAGSAARLLRPRIVERARWAEAVVVSAQHGVTMQLVLADIDRAVPVVPSVEVAAAIIRVRAHRSVTEVA
jgi:hypothetical protein